MDNNENRQIGPTSAEASDESQSQQPSGRDRKGRFAKGNPGQPKGSRHRATLAAEALLDGEAESLTRTAIDAAHAGSDVALRLCLERIIPPRKVRPIKFELPPLKTAADGPVAIAAIADAAAAGDLTTDEADGFVRMVEAFVKTFEVSDMEARLRRLEAAAEK